MNCFLYPSLCFFEGTDVSIGRGTDFPFQIIGSPYYKEKTTFSFIPKANNGSKNPKFKGLNCKGYNLQTFGFVYVRNTKGLYLHWLLGMNNLNSDKKYINRTRFFDLLAGNNKLREQIESNKSLDEIKESWQIELDKYKLTRKKYLLYSDF